MKRPQPKELSIIRMGPSMLYVYVSSEDAARWIEREAPDFGHMHFPDTHALHYTIIVSPTYDIDEVQTYLASYGRAP